MTIIKTVVRDSQNVEPNRFLQLNVQDDTGHHYLSYAESGFPQFRSSSFIEKGSSVSITIADNPIWNIEAGEKITTGNAIHSSEEGKALARTDKETTPAFLFGYAANDAEEGEIVKVVRSPQLNGNWVKEVGE